ncbi:hypothetical protein [Calothrix sp. NIES-2098]|uniref:hypothetical protein n=1 Tax=Calothrix sp. NIES-2098 TaxID=1954171 RepID=UPI000B5FCE05|nr:hypothetical protein NIES2098_42140 [Calothrix sp. NIES-2098]
MPKTKQKNYLVQPTARQIREIQRRNLPLIGVYRLKWNKTQVVFDLCEGFLGTNRYQFTPAGRLAIHQIMTSRPHHSYCVWELSERCVYANYKIFDNAIAVAELLGQLPEKHLETPMWEWVD